MTSYLFDQFYKIGIIPVLEIDSADRAQPLAESLLAGGLPVAEVTFRTDAALESIRVIAREVTDVIVGAGTVINQEQAEAARDAGAQFLVSPGMVEDVIFWARENQIPILAGAVTPSEMIRGINLGLNILKFFPAETMGGPKAIKTISEPFPSLRFIPTGGIRLENMAEYLQMEKIHAVGGSWMAKRQLIAEGKFDAITRMAKQASDVVKQIRGWKTDAKLQSLYAAILEGHKDAAEEDVCSAIDAGLVIPCHYEMFEFIPSPDASNSVFGHRLAILSDLPTRGYALEAILGASLGFNNSASVDGDRRPFRLT